MNVNDKPVAMKCPMCGQKREVQVVAGQPESHYCPKNKNRSTNFVPVNQVGSLGVAAALGIV